MLIAEAEILNIKRGKSFTEKIKKIFLITKIHIFHKIIKTDT